MHTTLEAIIELDGRVQLLEPFKLVKPVRALITILADEPKPPPVIHFQKPETETDFSKLILSLTEFPDDFMAEGREQLTMPEVREAIC